MPGMKSRNVLSHAAAVAVFAGLSVAVMWPALTRPAWWGVHDWAQFYSYFGVPLRAIVEYHELPGWNPWYYGGNVQWGHPDDPTLSPLFLPVLLFGTVAGLKLDIVLVLAGGMYSMWLLARRVGASWAPAVFAAVVWGLNGWHAYHFAVGHMDHLTFLLQPLAVLVYLMSLDDLRWSAAAGAVIALMLLSGGPYPFVFTCILLAVLSLALAGQRNSLRPVKAAVIGVALAAGLAAAKLVATAHFTLASPPVFTDITGASLGVVWRALMAPRLPMVVPFAQTSYGSWEFAAYVGWVPLVLFAVGAVLAARRVWPWLLVAAVFLITAMGSASPVNFFSLFTAPPGLAGMHVPFRFIVHVILAAAVIGAVGLEWLKSQAGRLAAPFGAAVALAGAAAAAGTLVWMHYNRPVPVYRLAAYYTPPSKGGAVTVRPQDEISLAPEVQRFVPRTYPQALQVYLSFLRRERLSWGYDAVRLTKRAAFPGEEGYRGETYIEAPEAGRAEIVAATQSKYTVKYEAVADGMLVLNQNWFPGWAASGAAGPAGSLGGIVAAPVKAATGSVRFEFRPATRPIGLFISLVTAGGIAMWVARSRPADRRRKHSRTASS
jgi:hypothetical protein